MPLISLSVKKDLDRWNYSGDGYLKSCVLKDNYDANGIK